MMKIGNHAAFSTILRVLRRSLPGAPNRNPRQSSGINQKVSPSNRVQSLSIRGGNAGCNREQRILWRTVLYIDGNLRHPTK